MKQTGNLLIIALGIAVGAGGGLLLARSGLINWRLSGERPRNLSLASEAADMQGHFWEMHDRLYETQDQWGEATDARQRFVGYARDLRLNVEQFERDLDGEQTAQRVAADYDRGRSIEINSTPTIFINGREIPKESITPKGIRGTIDAALKERSR